MLYIVKEIKEKSISLKCKMDFYESSEAGSTIALAISSGIIVN